MRTVRITHESLDLLHKVRIEFAADADFCRLTDNQFEFTISEQQQEFTRWYFEDFPHYPEDPAPRIAATAENILQNLGIELYQNVFRKLKLEKRKELEAQWPQTRIEIYESSMAEGILPWEWMSSGHGVQPLGISTAEFVYGWPVARGERTCLELPGACSPEDSIRVLLVTCRPLGDPVSYRIVAARLLRQLDRLKTHNVSIVSLRPPTLDQLSQTLARERDAGSPFHVVHFDGHGILRDPMAKYVGHRTKPQFFLKFEDREQGEKPVSARELADVLCANDVAALVLNACRSGSPVRHPGPQLSKGANQLAPSLALELTMAGVPTVVAMRYDVLPATAAQVFAEFYTYTALGWSLSSATAGARRSLAQSYIRKRGSIEIRFQDWAIPVLYQHVGVNEQLHAPKIPARAGILSELLDSPTSQTTSTEHEPSFVGRDNMLLKIDRAFDRAPIVILSGVAGCGKSALAREFGRWYQTTGGIRRVQTLSIDALNNLSANDQADPVMWLIDDNINGLQLESGPHREAIISNLNRLRHKVLLVVRGAVDLDLAKIVPTVSANGMPKSDQEELLKTFLENHGIKDPSTSAWHCLVEYAQGNPAALQLSVAIASANPSPSPALAGKLSLEFFEGASPFTYPMVPARWLKWQNELRIVIERHFSTEEHRLLSLLSQFRTTVSLRALHLIGNGIQQDWEMVIKESCPDDLELLLQRAERTGLLAKHLPGIYFLPPLSQAVLDHFLPEELRGKDAILTYVVAVGITTCELVAGVREGHVEARQFLILQQPNTLRALRLARSIDCWQAAFNLIQSLLHMYRNLGAKELFMSVFKESLPIFEDEDGWPLPDRISAWSAITQYWGYAAEFMSNWNKAERALSRRIKVLTKEAKPILSKPMQDLSPKEVGKKRRLVVALEHLGTAQRHQKNHECVATYSRALNLLHECTDPDEDERVRREAGLLLNLATAFIQVDGIEDFEKAIDYATRGQRLIPEQDKLHLARAYKLLGQIAYLKAKSGLLDSMQEAKQKFKMAVRVFPSLDADERLDTMYFLSLVELQLDHYDRAIELLREILPYYDKRSAPSIAAETRYSFAVALSYKGLYAHAMEYVDAALSGYKRAGADSSKIDQCLDLKTQLENIITNEGRTNQ